MSVKESQVVKNPLEMRELFEKRSNELHLLKTQLNHSNSQLSHKSNQLTLVNECTDSLKLRINEFKSLYEMQNSIDILEKEQVKLVNQVNLISRENDKLILTEKKKQSIRMEFSNLKSELDKELKDNLRIKNENERQFHEQIKSLQRIYTNLKKDKLKIIDF